MPRVKNSWFWRSKKPRTAAPVFSTLHFITRGGFWRDCAEDVFKRPKLSNATLHNYSEVGPPHENPLETASER